MNETPTFDIDKLALAWVINGQFLSATLLWLSNAGHHAGALHDEVYNLVLVRLAILVAADGREAFEDDGDEEVDEDDVEGETEEAKQHRTDNRRLPHHALIVELVWRQ